jgi:hypothetical protein
MKKKTETMKVASKETGLEVNAEKTKYMVTCREGNAGRGHNIGLKIGNKSFEMVEQFRLSGTTLTNLIKFGKKLKAV